MKIVTAMSLVASLAVSSAFAMEGAFEADQNVELGIKRRASSAEASVSSAESLSKKLPPANGKGNNTYTGGWIVTEGIYQLSCNDVMNKLVIEERGAVDLNGFDLEVVEECNIEGKLINTGHLLIQGIKI